MEMWLERVDGRKITTRGRLVDEDGELLAEAEGLFITLAEEHIQAIGSMMRGR